MLSGGGRPEAPAAGTVTRALAENDPFCSDPSAYTIRGRTETATVDHADLMRVGFNTAS